MDRQARRPLADFAQLTGEVLGVDRAPVSYELHEGKGTLKVGSFVEAEMTPYVGSTGQTTTLNDSVFSSIPGLSRVGKQGLRGTSARAPLSASRTSTCQDHNAIQGTFRFAA